MKISNRLKELATLVDDDSYVLDVGCDHALLSIYLVLNNKNIQAVASDNKPGPLEMAKKNIVQYQLSDQVTTSLANGIEKISQNINTIVIAGMGGINISEILSNDVSRLNNVKTIILGPNNDQDLVRKTLNKLGYFLINEILVEENKKVYYLQKYIRSLKRNSKIEIEFGHQVLYTNKLFKKDLQNKAKVLEEIITRLPKKKVLLRYKKRKELKKVFKLVNKLV